MLIESRALHTTPRLSMYMNGTDIISSMALHYTDMTSTKQEPKLSMHISQLKEAYGVPLMSSAAVLVAAPWDDRYCRTRHGRLGSLSWTFSTRNVMVVLLHFTTSSMTMRRRIGRLPTRAKCLANSFLIRDRARANHPNRQSTRFGADGVSRMARIRHPLQRSSAASRATYRQGNLEMATTVGSRARSSL